MLKKAIASLPRTVVLAALCAGAPVLGYAQAQAQTSEAASSLALSPSPPRRRGPMLSNRIPYLGSSAML